jgi:hypothetical protein
VQATYEAAVPCVKPRSQRVNRALGD